MLESHFSSVFSTDTELRNCFYTVRKKKGNEK